MSEESLGSVVESVYRSRLANDVAGCLRHFAPDAAFRIAGSPEASPIAASCNDCESLRRFFSELVATWQWRNQKIESITVQGDRAAVHYRLEALYTPSGDVVHSELLDLLTVRKGKIVSLLEFVDTAFVAGLSAKVSGRHSGAS